MIDYKKVIKRTNELLKPDNKTKKYYNGELLAEHFADKAYKYAFCFGGKATGKTTWWLVFITVISWFYKRPVVLMRRWDDAFKGSRPNQYFTSINNMGIVRDLTNNEWDGITYYRKAFYYYKLDDNLEQIKASEPFMYCRALTTYENDNGTQIDNCAAILLDEFIPRGRELPDEVELYFKPCISSIKRRTDDTIIICCGNTINKFSTYFSAFGFDKASEMPEGTIITYENESGGKAAIERTGDIVSKEENDIYFNFGNKTRQTMIDGSWELAQYPRPVKYKPKDVIAEFFIKFYNYCLKCELVIFDNQEQLNIYPYKFDKVDTDKAIIYTTEYNIKPNYRRNLLTRTDPLSKEVVKCFNLDLVRFSDNSTGNIVDSYLNWCQMNRGVKYDKA